MNPAVEDAVQTNESSNSNRSIDTKPAAAIVENIDFPNDIQNQNHINDNNASATITNVDEVDCCGIGPSPTPPPPVTLLADVSPIITSTPININNDSKQLMCDATVIAQLQIECDHLKTALVQKEETIEMQRRELRILGGEKSIVCRDLEQSRREKETAVVKYAMAEKSLIDLRTSNDQLTRRLKDAAKELDGHSSRLKFITGERERANRDLRKSVNECEALKTELVSLETKLKWNQVKIKQDAAAKTTMETRINELLLQVNQFAENEQQNLNAVRYEEKETEAQLILLKHTSEERERECVSLTTRLEKLKRDYDDVCTNFRCSQDEVDRLRSLNGQHETTIDRFRQSTSEQTVKIESVTEELNEVRRLLDDKQKRLDETAARLDELIDIKVLYDEQLTELGTLRGKEESLMLFIKELTEKSVRLESQLTLSTAKSSALALETERIRSIYEEHKKCVVELESELVELKIIGDRCRVECEDRVSEARNECDRCKLERDNALGELDATRRKNAQVIKELHREVQMERSKTVPKTENKTSNGGNTDEAVINREPSKKMLIDRIGRLQRALARQTEKIEFLENHCAGLINEIKCKS